MSDRLVKCRSCAYFGPETSFIGSRGKPVTSCERCRTQKNSASKAKRKIAMATMTQEGVQQQCIKCFCTPCDDEFINEKGKRGKICENCREADRDNKKRRMAKAQEIGEQKCSRCTFQGPPSAFVKENGHPTKKCQACRTKAAQKVVEILLAAQESAPENTKVCTKCCEPKDLSQFRYAEAAECLFMQCIQCNEKSKPLAAKYRKRLLEEEGADVTRAKSRKGHKYRPRSNERLHNQCKFYAKKRGISFTLTLAQSSSLFESSCFYCGQRDATKPGGKCGIDRYNNSIGYTWPNSVACCCRCNRMKLDLSAGSFVALAGHISVRFGGCGELLDIEAVAIDCHGSSFDSYRSSAAQRGYEFTLTRSQFDEIVSGDCYLCGKKNTATHSNGIDRVDNSLGYFYGGCRACCWTCNRFKLNTELGALVRQCGLIYTDSAIIRNFRSDRLKKQKRNE